ncbi:protein-serine/threonine phosphatase [Trifolium repens]|nr:protein-serine/threonine phosphatase [Trifolium repens]
MSSTAVAQFVCPWACLASAPPKISVAPPPVISNRSFAQALLNKVDFSLTQLPKPCMKGIIEEGDCSSYFGKRRVSAGYHDLKLKFIGERKTAL